MAQKIIDTTTPQPNGKIGDTAKVAFGKVNDNFAELYASKANASHTHSASDITSGTLSDARLPSTMSGKTFTGTIITPGVAIGNQQGYLFQSNSVGAISVRVGTVGNEKFFAFSEDGRFYALLGGASFNGDVVATGFINASSRELKNDIRPLHVDADIIDRFQPVTFRYKAAPEREVAGLILEDVVEIFPLACAGDGIDYGQLVPMLIATIQHDRAQLRDLAARVEALEQTLGQTLHDLPAQPTGDSEA